MVPLVHGDKTIKRYKSPYIVFYYAVLIVLYCINLHMFIMKTWNICIFFLCTGVLISP